MKKNLLITLGCSFTEGVGCYSQKLTKKEFEEMNNNLHDFHEREQPRFHEYGWPNRLGKKLGYDKVINLGLGGTSNSAHVKSFVERILPQDLSEWNVLVVWMMTDPSRFSFYSGIGNDPEQHITLKDFMPGNSEIHILPLEEEWTKEIDGFLVASRFEQKFYVQCMEQICENNNFKLLLTGWDNEINFLPAMHKSKYYLHPHMRGCWWETSIGDRTNLTAICGHPNEDGYEAIAELIFSWIRKFHTYIKVHSQKELEWEWLGEKTDIIIPEARWGLKGAI